MDRWEDADDDIEHLGRHQQGRVARLGIAGFAKAAVAGSAHPDGSSTGRTVIVSSKREQRAVAAQLSMPPPPSLAMGAAQAAKDSTGHPAAAAAAALPRPATPAGATAPPAGAMLLVHKAGALVQQITLSQAMTVFGRLPCNDVVLDHASISRQHAVLCFRQQQQQQHPGTAAGVEAVLSDLGSAHGTFVQGKRLAKGQLFQLPPGDVVQFGASTRTYTLQLPDSSAAGEPSDAAAGSIDAAAAAKPAQRKRARVRFADDAQDDDAPAAGDGESGTAKQTKHRSLEQVVGYTDSSRFTPRVGPQPVAAGSEQGKFAHLLEANIIIKPAAGRQAQLEQRQQQQAQGEKGQQQQQSSSEHSLPEQQNSKGQQQVFEAPDMTAAAAASSAAAAAQQDEQQEPAQQEQQQACGAQHHTADCTAQAPAEGQTSSSTPLAEHRLHREASPAAAAAAAAPGAAGVQGASPISGAGGITRTWPGGASGLVVPPQSGRKAAAATVSSQQQQQWLKQQQALMMRAGVASSLYTQLPAARTEAQQEDDQQPHKQ